ncbi:hypothetical protein G6F22_012483 [Rhizopus arrhizus]|nr:hypothetical protein G6F22_012483 [Rhizopus arrhizus]
MDASPVIMPHVASGKLRALAVAADKRLPSAPAVPASTEVGDAQLQISSWNAFFAPAGTPPDVVNALSRGIADAVALPALKQQLAGYGYETVGSTPADFASHIDRELDAGKPAVDASGAKLN